MKTIRYYLPERLRWRVVALVNRLPGQCWSDLCDWAGSWKDDDPGGFIGWPWWAPWRPDQSTCREDVARCGTCYCGKLRDDVQERKWVDAVEFDRREP